MNQNVKPDKVRKLVIVSLLVALHLVLNRFLEIPISNFGKISLSFIPIAITSSVFGPGTAVVAGVAEDLLGATLFPKGAYFPGFTVTAAVNGLIYGLLLHNREREIKYVVLAAVLSTLIGNTLLSSLWISMITGMPYTVAVVSRLPGHALMIAAKVIILPIVLPRLAKEVRKVAYK